jgi:hypothetical protein
LANGFVHRHREHGHAGQANPAAHQPDRHVGLGGSDPASQSCGGRASTRPPGIRYFPITQARHVAGDTQQASAHC